MNPPQGALLHGKCYQQGNSISSIYANGSFQGDFPPRTLGNNLRNEAPSDKLL